MANSRKELFEEYAFAGYLATVTITILYNIYLIVKIRYGDVLITKSTLRPYYLSLLYLVLCFVKSFIRHLTKLDLEEKDQD